MAKKRDFSVSFVVFIAALIPFVFVGYQLIQLIKANQTLDAYKQAPICSGKPNCREVVDVVIAGTKNIGTSFGGLSVTKKPYTTTTKKYQVVISLGGNNTKAADFYPYSIPDLNKFDVVEFGISQFQTNSFAEIYLPVGDKVKVEMWHGNITIIFMNYYTEEPPSITPAPDGNPILVAAAKTFFEVPIATTSYPSYATLQAGADFIGSIFILFFAEFIIFAGIKLFR